MLNCPRQEEGEVRQVKVSNTSPMGQVIVKKVIFLVLILVLVLLCVQI